MTQQDQENKLIAQTIISQIGKYTLALIGADTYLYDKDYLQFKTKTRKINTVIIKLNGLDLYDIELYYCKVTTKEPYIINNKINEINNVYADQLADILQGELLK